MTERSTHPFRLHQFFEALGQKADFFLHHTDFRKVSFHRRLV